MTTSLGQYVRACMHACMATCVFNCVFHLRCMPAEPIQQAR